MWWHGRWLDSHIGWVCLSISSLVAGSTSCQASSHDLTPSTHIIGRTPIQRAVGVEPIEQQHNGQAWKLGFEPRPQAVEGFQLTVLFVIVRVALAIAERFTQQRQRHPIM
jgi:hypothetical protein